MCAVKFGLVNIDRMPCCFQKLKSTPTEYHSPCFSPNFCFVGVFSGLNAPVGMSLYALQIVPFLDFIPREKILVLKSEDLLTRTDETFNRVLDFLGLTQISLQTYRTSNKGRGTAVDTKTRALLKAVFEPFNRKLVELLGDEWNGVWET